MLLIIGRRPPLTKGIHAERLPNAFVHRAAVKRQNNATAVVVEQDR
jgi:hypothetical protein